MKRDNTIKNSREWDQTVPDKSGSWSEFADNFLNRFFEGRSFSVWLFISGLLIVLYGRYASFEQNLMGETLRWVSFSFLVILILFIFFKNLIFNIQWTISEKLRSLIKFHQTYRYKKWLAEVLGSEPRKLNLPLKIASFKRIYSRVKVIDPGIGRWRAGIVFENANSTREYIFHVYQDAGSTHFRSRIVERMPNVKEVLPDVSKSIGVENPLSFEFWVESAGKQFNFYINGVFAGKYPVSINKINNIILAAWSDDKPIAVLFEDIEVIA